MYKIMTSIKHEVNTDPQRRCYNGCHYSSKLVDTPFEVLESWPTQEIVERRLKFWTELNDYAVSQRGESARRKFRVVVEESDASN